jgi:hypothetical protein
MRLDMEEAAALVACELARARMATAMAAHAPAQTVQQVAAVMVLVLARRAAAVAIVLRQMAAELEARAVAQMAEVVAPMFAQGMAVLERHAHMQRMRTAVVAPLATGV